MSARKRIAYLARYYWTWALVLLLALWGIFLVRDWAANRSRVTVLEGLITNDDWNRFPADSIAKDFGASLGLTKKEQILLDDSLYIDENGGAAEIAAASRGKIIAEITAKKLDFVITEESVLRDFEEVLPFLDLGELLPEDLASRVSGDLISEIRADGTKISALSLRDSRFLRGTEEEVTKNYVLFAPASAPHREALIAFLRYCYDE